MKKKVISVLLATAMVTGLVAGCGSSSEGGSNSGGGEYDGVELTYWSHVVKHRAAGKSSPGSS